mgnify:CR=1 FL=1
MTLGEKMKEMRLARGLSQEKLAEQLYVTRQAVAKWEKDQTMPSAENLLLFAELFDCSLDELMRDKCAPPKRPTMQQLNLTRLAVIMQASALSVLIQPIADGFSPRGETVIFLIKCAAVFLMSIWMVSNLRFEKNLAQRRKNARIECLYCCIMAAIAIPAWRGQWGFLGTVLIMTACMVYLLVVQPRYMNRPFEKKKKKQQS